jgi:hypothetical protein
MNFGASPPGRADPLTATTFSDGHLQQPLEHDGYGEEGVAAVCHQGGERGGRVEAAVQHDGGPQREAHLERGESPGVEDRGGDQHPVLRVQGDAVDDGHERPETAGCGPAGALGSAGGARGQHDDASVALRRVQLAGQRPGHQLLAGALVEAGQLGGEAEDPVGELVVVHQQPQPLFLGDGRQLGGGEARVDEHRVDAEEGRRDDRLDQSVVVAAEDADPVARLYADPGSHRPGHPLGPVEERLVGQLDAVLVDDRRSSGVAGGRLA